MLNRSNSMFTLTLFLRLALSVMTYSDTIQEWPTRDGINLEPAKQRFIELFESDPENFIGLIQGVDECQLDVKKIDRISNVNYEALAAPYKNMENMEAEIDLDIDIDKLIISSTAEGCTALSETKLELLPYDVYGHYRVSPMFTHSFLIHTDYSVDSEYVFKIEGGADHESESSSETISYLFYSAPNVPTDKAYPQEIYEISEVKTDVFQLKNYSLTLVSSSVPVNGPSYVTLTRSTNDGVLKNSLNLIGKKEGLESIEMIGNHTLTSMLGGEMHGLMIHDNHAFASDKSKEPYTYTCYDMGEKFNVFKKLANNTCAKVEDDQIDMSGVYVDQIYQIQLDSQAEVAGFKRKVATKMKAHKVATEKGGDNNGMKVYMSAAEGEQYLAEQKAKKEKEHEFVNKQK